jgi:hypothetical protein
MDSIGRSALRRSLPVPDSVQVVLLQVLAIGAVVLVPSLLFLFGIFGPRGQKSGSSQR